MDAEHTPPGKYQSSDPKSPLVSVVMGVYNGGQFLEAAVRSILDQTFRDFEFIIIDDGSTDDSVSIIKSLDDPRIRLIKQKHRGLVASLNAGISLARGEYIARMDADDISLPSRLDEELTLMTSQPEIGVVGTFVGHIDEDGTSLSRTIVAPIKSIDLKRSLYVVNPFGHGSTLIRRLAFKEVGNYCDDYGPAEDFELWRRIARTWELAVVPKVLYLYRINSRGISQQKQKIQHTFASKIISEQWQQPFLKKKLHDIIADGTFYKSIDQNSGTEIYILYVREQFVIAIELFTRGKFFDGILTTLAVCILDRKQVTVLLRPAIGGLLRIIGLREKKK